MTDLSKPRAPSLREAILGRLDMRGFPMGPDEATSVVMQAIADHQDGKLEVCACGWHVVLCRHRQPWVNATHPRGAARV
jgi:hypothetical protein